jgi:NADPH2:quinone reductase
VKNYSILGLHWGLYRTMEPSLIGEVHADLVRLFEAGQISPLVGSVLPLDQAPQALTALADRSSVGKIVLVP